MSTPQSKIHNLKSDAGLEFISGSVEDTQTFGERLGRAVRPGDVVALQGELGSGKTTLIQGIARGLGRDPETIKSPTFVLMREYPGEVPLVHVDGYRLEGVLAVAALDLDFVFSEHKVTVIEWAERFAGLLPADYLQVYLSHVSANRRRLKAVGSSARGQRIISQLQLSAAPESTGQPANRPTDSDASSRD